MIEDNRSDSLPEDLEVLKSIYPELEIDETSLSLEINLNPEYHNIEIQLCSEKDTVLQSVESRYFQPLKLVAQLPVVDEEGVDLKCWFLNEEVLRKMMLKIHKLINDSIELDMQDSMLYTIIDYMNVDLAQEFYSLVFHDDKIKTTSTAFYNKVLETSHDLRLLKFAQERFTCSICLDPYDSIYGILLDYDHAFCKACFKEYAIQMINSDDVTKLQCPNCPIHILKDPQTKPSKDLKTILFTPKVNINILSQVLDTDMMKRYELQRHNLLFERYSQYFPLCISKCPACSTYKFRDDDDDYLVICDHCRLAYCFECKRSWHGKFNNCRSKSNFIPTDIVEQFLKDPSEIRKKKIAKEYGIMFLNFVMDQYNTEKKFRETVAKSKDLMGCPRCSTVINKSYGCNKMICTLCNTKFCFLCGEFLGRDCYEHYIKLESPCYGKLFLGMPGAEDL